MQQFLDKLPCESWIVPQREFLAQAEQAGLMNLKGHRSVGGMRASIYNAVPMEAIDVLIAFMQKFEANNA